MPASSTRGVTIDGDILIKDNRIERVGGEISFPGRLMEIDAKGNYLIPGAIDDQVHFREPGLTIKVRFIQKREPLLQEGSLRTWKCPALFHKQLRRHYWKKNIKELLNVL